MKPLTFFNAVIIDDEPKALANLRQALAPLENVHILGEARTDTDGSKLIEDLKPDIVFLDIDLASGDGFSLLDQLDHRNFHLVFVTGHSEFAVKAFKYAAVNYVVKPYQPEDIHSVVRDLEDREGARRAVLDELLSELRQISTHERSQGKFGFVTTQGIRLQTLADVVYIKSIGKQVSVHLTGNDRFVAFMSLKELEAGLEKSFFYRIGHGELVNCSRIESYNPQKGLVRLDTGQSLGVSVRRRKNFHRFMVEAQ
jgi:two-component system LytT family response regulator